MSEKNASAKAEKKEKQEENKDVHATVAAMTSDDRKSTPLTIEALFKAGAYFGHMKSRRNPKMDEFVYTYRENVAIIDTKQTLKKLQEALSFLESVAAEGKSILFVGTKRHIRDLVRETAQSCKMPFVEIRWLGGTFTNFESIKGRVKHLEDLKRRLQDDDFSGLTKFEKSKKREEAEGLEEKLGGLRNMPSLPGAVFVADVKHDMLAVREANRSGVPVVAIVDTNDDPKGVSYVIPANNDAISSVRYLLGHIANAIETGNQHKKSKEASEKDAEKK
jgi:small subunit ribosomal protein S2